MKDEHDVEAVLHRILDQALEAGALVRVTAGLEVEVLLDQRHAVLSGVAGDGLALPVGRVAPTLLLGGLAYVRGGATGLLRF
ncbi:MAG TPA: hypothetical protein VGL68_06440 [Solirubrobacteraceae bacterium]